MKKRSFIFWCTLLVTMLLRYGYYGLAYFPVVDDHNMYGIFSMLSPGQALYQYRMYTTRPLAALLDAFVISRLWGKLWMVLLLLTILHFLSCYLIYLILKKNNMETGTILTVTFALLPLGIDATYWIPASSRIVTGMFFALLSFFLYMKYIEKDNLKDRHASFYLTGFAVTNLASLGFYEQVIAFSFIGSMALIAVNFKRQRNKWVSAIPIVNTAAIGLFYFWFRNTGNMAERGQLINGNFYQHSIDVLKKISGLMINTSAGIIKHGAVNGAKLLLSDRAVVFILLAVLASVILGVFFSKEKINTSWRVHVTKLIVGFVLVILPFAPFFVLQATRIVYRNAYMSIAGVGLIAEGAAGILFHKWSFKVLRGVVAGIVVFVFLLCSVAELNDYRAVSGIDRKITANLAVALEEAAGQDWTKRDIVVFNTSRLYVSTTSRHLSNCTASDWQLAGAMRSYLRLKDPLVMEPVVNEKKTAISREMLEKGVFAGLDSEGRAFPLIGEWTPEGTLDLQRTDGTLFGRAILLDNDTMIKFTAATEHTG